MGKFRVYLRRKNKNFGDLVTPQPIEARSEAHACKEIYKRHGYAKNRLFAVAVKADLIKPDVEMKVGQVISLGVYDGVGR